MRRNRMFPWMMLMAVLFSCCSMTKAVGHAAIYAGPETLCASAAPDEIVVSTSYYDTLGPASQVVYDHLVENMVALRDGKTELRFLFPESVQYEDLSVRMYQDAVNAFNRDHSEVFWLDMAAMKLTVTVLSDGSLEGVITPVADTYYTDAYTSREEVERDIALMEDRIAEITAEAAKYETVYERLLYIHDWLVLRNACNTAGISAHMRAFEAVSALEGNIEGDSRPVCEGYARAFKLLCDALGIPCILVTGEGFSGGVTEAHMWNYVKVDGTWYAADVTWDDPLYLEGTGLLRDTYFLIGSETLCDEGMTFTQNHKEVTKLSTYASHVGYPVISKSAYRLEEAHLTGSLERITVVQTYQPGLFSDVESGAWYEEGVSLAYGLGLMNGTGDGRFDVNGTVSIAEALTMAARIHAKYYGEEESFRQTDIWYEPYVEYAFAHNLTKRQFSDYGAAITRTQFAELFAATLPEAEFPALVDLPEGSIPDIPAGSAYAEAAYLLYRAGVLIGDEQGAFQPDATISRAEVALILTRIVDPDLRVTSEIN